jgi:hypothetical protein
LEFLRDGGNAEQERDRFFDQREPARRERQDVESRDPGPDQNNPELNLAVQQMLGDLRAQIEQLREEVAALRDSANER